MMASGQKEKGAKEIFAPFSFFRRRS